MHTSEKGMRVRTTAEQGARRLRGWGGGGGDAGGGATGGGSGASGAAHSQQGAGGGYPITHWQGGQLLGGLVMGFSPIICTLGPPTPRPHHTHTLSTPRS